MKLNKLFFGLAALTALSFTACSDDDVDYQRGAWDAAAGYADVYFKDLAPSVELDPVDECAAPLQLYRRPVHEYTYAKDSEGNDSVVSDKIVSNLPAMTVKFDVTENTDNVFTVGDATFAEGDTVTTFKVDFPKAEIGKPYKLGLNISDDNLVSPNYSSGDYCTFTVNRVKWNDVGFYFDENGNKVEGYCMFTEDYVTGFFGVDNVSYPIVMQERDDRKGYFRMKNVYGASYPYNEPGDWDTSQDYYIYIDATDPAKVFIPHYCEIGMDWGYGMFRISSIAGLRLAQDRPADAEGNYGTYANGIISFPKEALLISMANYNSGGFYTCNSAGLFKVVVDPTLNPYRADVAKDFEYTKLFDGVLMSGQRGTTTNTALYEGKCITTTDKCDSVFAADYGTAYCVESPYAEGYNLYFSVKENGDVAIPEGYELQPTGLNDNAGHDIFAKLSTMSTYQENYVTLVVTFQTEDGELVYGTSDEIVANLTYSEVGKGVYTYGVGALSQNAGSYYEGADEATLFQCDQLKGSYYLKPWASSEDGLNFTIGADGKIRFYQNTGDQYEDYGDVYFIDLEAYNPDYTRYLGEYDDETKTFEFCGIYVIPGVGGFGLISETFQLGVEVPAPARAAEQKSLSIFKDYKAPSRFVATKVNRKQLQTPKASAVK